MHSRKRHHEAAKEHLRKLARASGVDPPEDELDEVAEFFTREGPAALPKLRAAFEAMRRTKRQ